MLVKFGSPKNEPTLAFDGQTPHAKPAQHGAGQICGSNRAVLHRALRRRTGLGLARMVNAQQHTGAYPLGATEFSQTRRT